MLPTSKSADALPDEWLEAARLLVSGEAETPTHAARLAGVSLPEREIRRFWASAAGRALVREERHRLLAHRYVPHALRALGDVLKKPGARDADRVKAASVVLDHVARLEGVPDPRGLERRPEDMSVAELEAYIQAAETKLRDVTPAPAQASKPPVIDANLDNLDT